MIELVMYVALGFLLASVIALLISRPLWRRAVRLTTLRLESTLPMSRTDMQAERDELRAEYAIRIRNLEMALEREKAKSTRHLVDRNKSRAAAQSLGRTVEALKSELAERDSHISVLEQNVRYMNGASDTPPAPVAQPGTEAADERPTTGLGAAAVAARERIRRQTGRDAPAAGSAEDENSRLKTKVEKLQGQLAKLRGTSARDWDLLKTEVTDLAEHILQGSTDRKTRPDSTKEPAPQNVVRVRARTRPAAAANDQVEPGQAVAATAGRVRASLRSRLGSLAQRLESLTDRD